MIIGDSLHSDIQGYQQAKIQTVWLNPTSAPATPTIQPNYTIQQLDELLPIKKQHFLYRKCCFNLNVTVSEPYLLKASRFP